MNNLNKQSHAFLRFAIDAGVLRFGNFTLKSGRQSPYFFNAGLFHTGAQIAQLGRYYAATLVSSTLNYDMLFGPAYKGIPLAVATAIALAEQHGYDVPYAFNRKETKDHGEGGQMIGAPLSRRVLIIDDVMTAGTAVREAVNLIEAAGAKPAGVIIALDRGERGYRHSSAVNEVQTQFGIPVVSIAHIRDLIQLLREPSAAHFADAATRAALLDYYRTHGVDSLAD
ncbi:orotate phosphoribosyltransferase [Rhodoferax sp. 4810]|uniref:Orotate phosphoribosyltransferase n=1 Tax=Thiospirillum jenense TaxID=1653858 RepID=A0A839HEL8_9GAMM|nr:orotate phosphoribosyltransferase [Thiospirillum jenense]MBB1073960.1 orotate phosphoribosyltransferase [Rhodoferax jenense]MBB1125836.1 orotate phosphoribosyltransferase [Thiospirillum jenense]